MEYYISQGISIVATIANLLAVQFKKMQYILLMQIIANTLLAISYVLIDGFSGFFICLMAVPLLVVIYLYNKFDKKPNVFVVGAFALVSIIYSVITFKTIIDILPLLAILVYQMGLISNKPSILRFSALINAFFWIAYDVCILSINVISHICLAVSTFIAMVRNDRLFGIIKRKTEETGEEKI